MLLRSMRDDQVTARDGVLRFSRGERDPNVPFDGFLRGLIETIDNDRHSRGLPPLADGRWRQVKRKAPKPAPGSPSPEWVEANRTGWLERALNERDQNRKLHLAFQAGREMAADAASRAHGANIRRGTKSLEGTRAGGLNSRKDETDLVIERIAERLRSKARPSVRAACIHVARELHAKEPWTEIEKLAERYRARWNRHGGKKLGRL